MTPPAGDRATRAVESDVSDEIDLICDEFESAWKTGTPPEIPDFLARTLGGDRSTLFVELVRLDLHYGEINGQTRRLEDYFERYPEYSEALQSLRGELTTAIYHPEKLGRFELRQLVGYGGFGNVYRAWDPQLHRFVAIKIPNTRKFDGDQTALFMREARSAARLNHQGIVAVHESGEIDGQPYIASEFIDGCTLNRWLRWREVTPRDAAGICKKIAEAIDYAHNAGIVHRDLKPGNILVDSKEQPHVTDFGLSKRVDSESTMAQSGRVIGTLAYMSPEQASGTSKRPVDHRTDVYALGAILYELLTHRTMFKGDPPELLYQIHHREPVPPRSRGSHIPKDLETICLKATRKLPEERYQTAGEMAEDLGRFLEGRPIRAKRTNIVGHTVRWMKRQPAMTGAIAVIALLLAGVAGLSWAIGTYPMNDGKWEVYVETDPPGAMVYAFLYEEEGKFIDSIYKNRTLRSTPGSIRLVPGRYRIVASINDDPLRRIEVDRMVPPIDADRPLIDPLALRPTFWEFDHQKRINWKTIEIPDKKETLSGIVASWVFVPLAERAAIGPKSRGLWVSPHEFTKSDFLELNGNLPIDATTQDLLQQLGMDDPYPVRTRFEATSLSERLGARLPTSAEFDHIVQACNDPEEKFLMLADQEKIRGLLTGVAEWTSSPPTEFLERQAEIREQADPHLYGVVRGGTEDDIRLGPRADDSPCNPDVRTIWFLYEGASGLGFRPVWEGPPPHGI